jgi:hypothetical protein
MMKKEHRPGIFFVDPSDRKVSDRTKKTVKTFLELENEPVDTSNLTGDYKKIIDVSYEERQKNKK